MSYLIGTGYYCGDGWRGTERNDFVRELRRVWMENTLDLGRIVTIASGDGLAGYWDTDLIHVNNLGHAHDNDRLENPPRLTGWSATFVTLAMLAYTEQCDFIFKEQDCLAFGPWIETMYSELDRTGAQMLVGRQQDANGMPLEQSLTIIKCDYILDFIAQFISIPIPDGGKFQHRRSEEKFWDVMHKSNGKIQFLPFGFGRARPKEWLTNEEPWYIQQVQPHELEELRQLSLV